MSLSPALLTSRLRGSLFGLAVGDALGAPYEFKSRGSYTISGKMELSYTFLDNGKPLPAGTWTDDTSLALCLGASLLEHSGLVWEDAALKMTKWYTDGYMSATGKCFDIGNATRQALDQYRIHSEHRKDTPMKLAGSTSRVSSGNGSLMRLAPIPVFFYSQAKEAIDNAALQSRVTHGSAMAVESCQLACAQITGFICQPENLSAEEKKERVLHAEFLPQGVDALDLQTDEVKQLRAGDWKAKSVDDISTSGFVIDSHEAALWALWNTQTFEQGMLKLLAMGGDVDTVCAIYGQIAGACYGIECIPVSWLEGLKKVDILEDVFGKLVKATVEAK